MKKLMGALLMIGVVACTSIEVLAPPVDQLYISEAGISAERAAFLRKGRKIYVNACSTCHDTRQVDDISAKAWKTHIPKMYKKAKLYPEEIEQVSAYIKTSAKINQRLIARREQQKR